MPVPKNLKKVKIDEHLKRAGGTGKSGSVKRGRPPGTLKKSRGVDGAARSTGLPESVSILDPADTGGDQAHPNDQPREVEAVYDTTAEARAVIAAPFGVVAGLAGISGIALSEPELDAVTPSFKAVYDKYLRPLIGENAEIYAFGLVMAGLIAKKVQVYNADPGVQAARARAEARAQASQYSDPETMEARAA